MYCKGNNAHCSYVCMFFLLLYWERTSWEESSERERGRERELTKKLERWNFPFSRWHLNFPPNFASMSTVFNCVCRNRGWRNRTNSGFCYCIAQVRSASSWWLQPKCSDNLNSFRNACGQIERETICRWIVVYCMERAFQYPNCVSYRMVSIPISIVLLLLFLSFFSDSTNHF